MTHSATRQHLAERLRVESVSLATQWLDRVHQLVTVSRLEVFPTRQLLDHFPEAFADIARYIERDQEVAITENTELIARAVELGELRQTQHASVHQLICEYRILAELLDQFVEGEVSSMERPDPEAVVVVMRRVNDAVRTMQQHTIDTFVANYTHTIERQTAQLRKFSRLVSHEIRQPLAVLQVLAKALPVTGLDDGTVRMMDIFDRSVSRLSEVTTKLERLARIARSTDHSPNERQVALTEVAHDAAAQLTDAAEARGVDIRVDPNLPVLQIDPARGELIFLNLVGNAIKFSDPAKRERYVEIRRGGGEEPSVIVRDNGVGMAPARLQTIFREFVRAHGQRDDDVRAWGLGLGLSIVRECMDHANGSVRVDSIEGRGTTFKLTWPVTSAAR